MPRGIELAGRVFVLWLVVTPAVYFLARPVLQISLPLLEIAIGALQSDYYPVLRIRHINGEPMITMRCVLRTPLHIAVGRTLPPGTDFDGGATHVAHVLLPLALFVWVAIARVAADGGRPRLLLLGLGALLVLSLTTPPLLAGRVASLLAASAGEGDTVGAPPLEQLLLFMEGGGRWLVGIVLGILCAAPAAPASAAVVAS
ncbi:MAG: hypothetical protein K2Y51_13500 [Gammaproteobacteria bacterium]|jgi:hypothetical protein|nr:hypothetical protein [Gammaproteobacteria bacterium]